MARGNKGSVVSTQLACSVFSSRLRTGCMLALALLVPLSVHAESTQLTEQAFTELLTGANELTPILRDLFDLNEDGLVGTADLVLFLIEEALRPPSVKFETSTSKVGEGGETSTEVVILFSEPFTGTLNFSIEVAPVIGNYHVDEEPPRKTSAEPGVDYDIAGPGLVLGSLAGGFIPASIQVADALETQITITTIDDTLFEDMERVILFLEPDGEDSGGGNYDREAPYMHTVFIDENDALWVCVYAVAPESDYTEGGEPEPLTLSAMGFGMEFTQLNGAFLDGKVFSDGRGPIPETSAEGIPVDFTGSSDNRFEAAFSVDLPPESSQMGFASRRTFSLVVDDGEEGHTFTPHLAMGGVITEVVEPIDAPGLSGLRSTSIGFFILSRIPSTPDNIAGRVLTVNTEGDGEVALDPEPAYVTGDRVTMTPIPDFGWVFDHWSGDLDGTDNPAEILMDGDKTVTAVFVEEGTD